MALLKIKDFDPNYRETFGGYDIKGLDVYSDINAEKIGTINDLLTDEQGHFRYFIVDLGFWGFGKKVMLPVGRSQIDNDGRYVHALGFTKEQAEKLPEFSENLKVDNNYEERVRGVYRTSSSPSVGHQARPVEAAPVEMRPLEASAPLGGYSHVSPPSPPPAPAPVRQAPVPPQAGYPPASAGYGYPQPGTPVYPPAGQAPVSSQPSYPVAEPGVYSYQQDPYLYGLNEQNHSVLQRYEERLIAKRRQAGHR